MQAQKKKILSGCALIIVDVQYDFMEGGSLEVPNASRIVPVINKLRDHVNFDLVVCSRDWHPADHSSFASNNEGAKLFEVKEISTGSQVMWPDHCVQGTKGSQIHESILRETDSVICKGMHKEVDSYSAFFDNNRAYATELKTLLETNGIHTVHVVGLATDYCVTFTANDAISCGFTTHLITDACAGINAADCDAAIEKFKNNGGIVETSAKLLEVE